MRRPPPDDEAEDVGPEIAQAIRDIVGDDDRPLTREEARVLKRLRSKVKRPSRSEIEELGRLLAQPEPNSHPPAPKDDVRRPRKRT